MNLDEVIIYWYPALHVVFDMTEFGNEDMLQRCSGRLEAALGEKLYKHFRAVPVWQEEPLTEDQRQKLLLLAGPHGKTIYKAMLARRKGNYLRKLTMEICHEQGSRNSKT